MTFKIKYNPNLKTILEDHFKDNPNKNLSLKKVSKKLGIKFRQAIYIANHSNILIQVDPHNVGCYKKNIMIFKLLL